LSGKGGGILAVVIYTDIIDPDFYTRAQVIFEALEELEGDCAEVM
jgi:hypothetical protein